MVNRGIRSPIATGATILVMVFAGSILTVRALLITPAPFHPIVYVSG